MIDSKTAYKNYFLRIVYVGFMEYIVNGIGIMSFNNMLKEEHMFDDRKGVNPKIGKLFRKFLESNAKILEEVSKNKFRVYTPKNICGGPLASPINPDDDEMMVREGIWPPIFVIDKELFRKTAFEKKELNKVKYKTKLNSGRFMYKDVHRKPIGCLLIHIKNQDKLPKFKTTHNYKCAEHEVRTILAAFHEGDIIVDLKFNGRNI